MPKSGDRREKHIDNQYLCEAASHRQIAKTLSRKQLPPHKSAADEKRRNTGSDGETMRAPTLKNKSVIEKGVQKPKRMSLGGSAQ